MTITLNLPAELEQYLLQEANEQGVSIEAMTDKLHSDKTKTSRGFTNQATESIWAISGQNLDE
jgi:hypothetical protein